MEKDDLTELMDVGEWRAAPKYRFGAPGPRKLFIPRSSYGGWVVREVLINNKSDRPEDQCELWIVRVLEPAGTDKEYLTQFTSERVHTFARKGHVVWKTRKDARIEKKRLIRLLGLTNSCAFDWYDYISY